MLLPAAAAGAHDRVSLTVRIDRAMHARLRALAARQQRTQQDIVEGALDAYLNVFLAGCACSSTPAPGPARRGADQSAAIAASRCSRSQSTR
jgi:hypothetical protein